MYMLRLLEREREYGSINLLPLHFTSRCDGNTSFWEHENECFSTKDLQIIKASLTNINYTRSKEPNGGYKFKL